jgi:hypothetical protein
MLKRHYIVGRFTATRPIDVSPLEGTGIRSGATGPPHRRGSLQHVEPMGDIAAIVAATMFPIRHGLMVGIPRYH